MYVKNIEYYFNKKKYYSLIHDKQIKRTRKVINNMCVVCQDKELILFVTECNHSYCPTCYYKVFNLKNTNINASCAYCRKKINGLDFTKLKYFNTSY